MFFTATTTTEVKSQIADLTLPDAQEAKDREKGQGQFLVNINKMGGVEAFGRSGLDEGSLARLIKDDYEKVKKLDPNASYRVLVRADKDLGWEKTKIVLKAAAAAGVGNVVFATTKGGKG
jgi:biopolymer transport protein ExbD